MVTQLVAGLAYGALPVPLAGRAVRTLGRSLAAVPAALLLPGPLPVLVAVAEVPGLVLAMPAAATVYPVAAPAAGPVAARSSSRIAVPVALAALAFVCLWPGGLSHLLPCVVSVRSRPRPAFPAVDGRRGQFGAVGVASSRGLWRSILSLLLPRQPAGRRANDLLLPIIQRNITGAVAVSNGVRRGATSRCCVWRGSDAGNLARLGLTGSRGTGIIGVMQYGCACIVTACGSSSVSRYGALLSSTYYGSRRRHVLFDR